MSDEYAFPLKEPLGSDSLGMTLRDYFAAKAMAALLAEPQWGEGSQTTTTIWGQDFSGPPDENKTAFVAYKIADAMMKAR